jgi:hypothetical protein
MKATVKTSVEEFFADFEKRGNDPSAVSDFFDDQFLSLDPSGSMVVRTDQLAAALPSRAAMFRTIGITGTRLASLALSVLDEKHVLVHTRWDSTFVEPSSDPLELSSSFLLRRTDRGWRVAVYLNHADIAQVIARRHAASDRPERVETMRKARV